VYQQIDAVALVAGLDAPLPPLPESEIGLTDPPAQITTVASASGARSYLASPSGLAQHTTTRRHFSAAIRP
jgi:hypothetical protein